MDKIFNIVIVGVGGQGLITLNNIIAQAAFLEGFEVRTSELHGLSQRGGSVQTFVRFGKKVYSPLVMKGEADLIFALEITEGLRAAIYSKAKTIFVVNSQYIMYEAAFSKEEVNHKINSLFGKKLHLLDASEICKKELGNDVVAGIYLLGYAIYKKLIPLKTKLVLKAIEDIIPSKYLEMNKKAFQLARKV